MARHNKWEDIAASLRNRIVSGELKPGQDFPSTLELMEEFKVYASTIQNAINALIREGLILSPGSGSKRRFVKPLVERSTRGGGFLTEFGKSSNGMHTYSVKFNLSSNNYELKVDSTTIRTINLPSNVKMTSTTFTDNTFQFDGKGIPDHAGTITLNSNTVSKSNTINIVGMIKIN